MPNYESYQVIKEITLDLVAPGLAPVVNVPAIRHERPRRKSKPREQFGGL